MKGSLRWPTSLFFDKYGRESLEKGSDLLVMSQGVGGRLRGVTLLSANPGFFQLPSSAVLSGLCLSPGLPASSTQPHFLAMTPPAHLFLIISAGWCGARALQSSGL